MSTRNRGWLSGALIALVCALAAAAYAATSIPFTNARLANGWKPGGFRSALPGYAKDALGSVHLRGTIRAGARGDAAFVLPKPLAPAYEMSLPTMTQGNAHGGLVIPTSGQVIPQGSLYHTLDGVSFLAGAGSKLKFTAATLRNGWRAAGGASAPPGYAIDSIGVVHLRGGLKGGSSSTEALALPKALAPGHNMWLPIFTSGATEGSLEITALGQVILLGSNTSSFASLDGISFVPAGKLKFTKATLRHSFKGGGFGSAAAGYAEDSLGVVHLRGSVSGQKSSYVAFVLPSALRPRHWVYVPMYTYADTEGLLAVTPAGQVVPYGGHVQDYASLDGVSFVAGQ